MVTDNALSLEIMKQFPVVEVKHENIKSQDSILSIDGVKLGMVLSEIGYPSSAITPMEITDSIPMSSEAIAQFDPYRKKVIISNDALIENVRDIYREALVSIGEEPSPSIAQEKDLLSKIIRSKVFQTVFPVFWPYNMLKNKYVPFFRGNSERHKKYFKAAKEGNLIPEKSLKEQRERATKHLQKLMEYAMQSATGWILSHEYEHANKRGRKTGIIVALGAAPLIFGSSILLAIDTYLQQQGQTLSSDVAISGLMLSMGSVLFGVAKGRSLDEQASYDAGYKNFAKVMECFKINHDVFAKRILGES